MTLLKMKKLWEEDTNGLQINEFQYVPEDMFDRQASTASYIWTIDYDTSDSTRKIYVKPVDAGTLDIRYYKLTTDLTATVTESGLDAVWNETIALGATTRLLKNAGRYNDAQIFDQEYRDRKTDTYYI